MKTVQQGFTLIELVMVIVILGILAATALPKFVDLSDDARIASAKGLAGSLSSASVINYAATKSSGGSKGYKTNQVTCDKVAGVLLDAASDLKFDSSETVGSATAADGSTSKCNVYNGTTIVKDSGGNNIAANVVVTTSGNAIP